MYDTYSSMAASGCYEDVMDYFAPAIGLAERAGMPEEAQRLEARLAPMRGVYRNQFS